MSRSTRLSTVSLFLVLLMMEAVAVAARSVEEMSKLGYGTVEQRARWGELLKKILPDVEAGDFLTGVNVRPRRPDEFKMPHLIAA